MGGSVSRCTTSLRLDDFRRAEDALQRSKRQRRRMYVAEEQQQNGILSHSGASFWACNDLVML